MAEPPRDTLSFAEEHRNSIDGYLPPSSKSWNRMDRPFVTLTFATSLDSQLALAPGVRTTLSGPDSKAMTHYLRSRHDAILIGVGTAVADDPGLNCRLHGAGGYGGPGTAQQPRPIIIDPSCRWKISESSKIIQMVREGRGLAPFVLTVQHDPPVEQQNVLGRYGGRYISLEAQASDGAGGNSIQWSKILAALAVEGLHSVMIEGGGQIINSLLATDNQRLIDSVIVTLAPTWLGRGGVVVSPERDGGPTLPVARLHAVRWHPLGEDVVLCGRLANGTMTS